MAIPFENTIVFLSTILDTPALFSFPSIVVFMLTACIAHACADDTGPKEDARIRSFRQAAKSLHIFANKRLTENDISIWFDLNLAYFRRMKTKDAHEYKGLTTEDVKKLLEKENVCVFFCYRRQAPSETIFLHI